MKCLKHYLLIHFNFNQNYVAGLENIEDMKTIINSKEDLTKTEQIHEVLKNVSDVTFFNIIIFIFCV